MGRHPVRYDREVANDRKRDAWTLLTSHGHVLVEIARNPDARIRDISAAAGITERAAMTIIADLDAAGYVTRSRVGRRNRYVVHLDLPFRHPAQHDLLVGPFLRMLAELPGESAPQVAKAAKALKAANAVKAVQK